MIRIQYGSQRAKSCKEEHVNNHAPSFTIKAKAEQMMILALIARKGLAKFKWLCISCLQMKPKKLNIATLKLRPTVAFIQS